MQNAEQYVMIEQANAVVEQSPVIVFRRKVVDNMLDEILYVSDNVKRIWIYSRRLYIWTGSV